MVKPITLKEDLGLIQSFANAFSAGGWVPDDADFEDATHLNDAGAKSFSARLAIVLSSNAAPAGVSHSGHAAR